MPNRAKERAQLAVVRAVLATLGAEITRGRKRLGFSQEDFASRVGCSRNTLRAIEAGKPSVEIGLFLDAAAHVDVPLMGGDFEDIRWRGHQARREADLLPQPHAATEIFDDF